jgi:hypothetical protein
MADSAESVWFVQHRFSEKMQNLFFLKIGKGIFFPTLGGGRNV